MPELHAVGMRREGQGTSLPRLMVKFSAQLSGEGGDYDRLTVVNFQFPKQISQVKLNRILADVQ
jgi:hypothetical protein